MVPGLDNSWHHEDVRRQELLMAIETCAQALDFLTGQTNDESIGLPSSPGELTLDRIRALLSLLEDPSIRRVLRHTALA